MTTAINLNSVLQEKAELLSELDRRIRTNKLKFYEPYPKQLDFHAAGAQYRERLFMAGNQLGKTLAGAAEMSMHLAGLYPDWWEGKRFDFPIVALAGSESTELTRDGVQRLLVGPPDREDEWGTGFIPLRCIDTRTRRQGVPNTLDTVTVRHASGGKSTLYFKSYDQGRTKWQANTVHFVWFDEEPPEDVYMEGITRTNATKGIVIVTFTPLKGRSSVVERYLGPENESPDRQVTTMTIDDAEHYTDEDRNRIVASYPRHERDARTKGIPASGSGLIFPVIEDDIVVEQFPIPERWPQIGGLDFGYDHPFAAVKLAHDRDNDIIYVTANYRKSSKDIAESQVAPVIAHAGILRAWGEWLPWAWPHDGLQHDKGTGEQLAEQYRRQGLNMLPERSTYPDGIWGVESGIEEMLNRMLTGRWKVFSNCKEWLEERRLYHRKVNNNNHKVEVVAYKDDTLCASRYAMMMIRFAKVKTKPVTAVYKKRCVY